MNKHTKILYGYLSLSLLILLFALTSCKNDITRSEVELFYGASLDQKETNDFTFLFNQISELQKQNLLVGAEVLIIRNDTIQLHDAVGWSNKEKGIELQKNSLYRIRSMTKPIIATAILVLIDEGKLSLEDRVSKYIPAFDNPNANEITVQQLLTHTGGLASHDYEEIGLSKQPYEFDSLSEVVNEIGQIGVIRETGKFYYSGSGIATLTELIALLSGISAEDFIQQRIFDPLGMTNSYTSFTIGVDWSSNLNPTYKWNDSINDFTQYWNPTLDPEYKYFRGHGGVYSSAMDYAIFLSMWLNKGTFNNNRILSEKIINQAQTTTVPLAEKGPFSHQSLAWKMLITDSITNQIGYFTHGGSDGTVARAYPKEKTIALYFNQSRNHPRFVFYNLMDITEPYDTYRKWNYNNEFLDLWKEILLQENVHENKVSVEQFESYVGQYKCITNESFNSEIMIKNNQLIIKNLQSGYECELFNYQENEFICRFRPPPDGFISKMKFNKKEGTVKSFTLEWINRTTFEFEKVK